VSDEGIMVNDANIIMADIMASNGVIHVIDKVLFPPEDDSTPATIAYEVPVKEVVPEVKCLTEKDCEEQMSLGYEKFEVGDFPLSGCFSKDGILYWGTGETFDESMDLDKFFQGGVVEAVNC
jgi:hypothetical protein